MRKTILLLAAAGSSVLSGCVAPMLTQHPVQFTSEPPGAMVTYAGKPIGTTPFVYDVRDVFGFFSTYEFTARLPNHPDVTLSFTEPTVFYAQSVVPGEVSFTFGTLHASKP
jgi:hypothetical protein